MHRGSRGHPIKRSNPRQDPARWDPAVDLAAGKVRNLRPSPYSAGKNTFRSDPTRAACSGATRPPIPVKSATHSGQVAHPVVRSGPATDSDPTRPPVRADHSGPVESGMARVRRWTALQAAKITKTPGRPERRCNARWSEGTTKDTLDRRIDDCAGSQGPQNGHLNIQTFPRSDVQSHSGLNPCRTTARWATLAGGWR